jgi:hypothetical protein
MRLDNPTAPARAATAPRAPNHAKARQTLPPRPITAPVQNEPTAPASGAMLTRAESPPRRTSPAPQKTHTAPQTRARRRETNPLSPLCLRVSVPHFLSPVSPSFPQAKPAITPRKPAKNPHFSPARLASISCPTLHPINPYINTRPRDTNHATFFPATHPSKPPLQKLQAASTFPINRPPSARAGANRTHLPACRTNPLPIYLPKIHLYNPGR